MVKRALLATLGFLAILLIGLAVANAVEAGRRDHKFVEARLTEAEKGELDEALTLKRALGDRVWPGFADADLPLILFNDHYEFLVGLTSPPSPWTPVEGDEFEGRPYYRREALDPQAFAVQAGESWAGSIGTLERMNRDYLLGVREQLPPVLAQLFPYPFATLSRDLHVVTVLHEAFHAYQATVATARFQQANEVYRLEGRYPIWDPSFEEAWNAEGRELAAALEASSDEVARDHVRAFLSARDSRRLRAGLGPDLIGYEQDLEWLEGLAKHVEIKVYELSARESAGSGAYTYQPNLPYWQQEFARIDGGLGGNEGDYRFYLSGMAQARLLDRLWPEWSHLRLSDVTLESQLAMAVGRDQAMR